MALLRQALKRSIAIDPSAESAETPSVSIIHFGASAELTRISRLTGPSPAMSTSPTCLICLDLQPSQLSDVRLLSIRNQLRAQGEILAAARSHGHMVIHLRQAGEGAATDFLRLAPQAGEAVFQRASGANPFMDLAFRRHLNTANPQQIELMAARRSMDDAALAIDLTNVGFKVHLLAETLQPRRSAFDPLMLASQTALHHPGLQVARGLKRAVPAAQRRVAND